MGDYRILLDYGHGGEKSGAVYAGIQEKALNLQLGSRLYQDIHEQCPTGDTIRVVLTRDQDEHVPLSVRIKLINQYHRSHPINNLVSVHFNAAPSVPAAKGFEVYYLKGSNAGERLAKTIVKETEAADFNNRGRGYKTTESLGRKLAMIHKTSPPAVLLECGFLSNEEDLANAIDPAWQERLSTTLAKAIWADLLFSQS
jgi:N-acetylmuramoyl-L-alanine amidase